VVFAGVLALFLVVSATGVLALMLNLVADDAYQAPARDIFAPPVSRPTYDCRVGIDPDTLTFNGRLIVTLPPGMGQDHARLAMNLWLNAYRDDADVKPVPARLETAVFPYGRDDGWLDIEAVQIGEDLVDFTVDGTVLWVTVPTQPPQANGASLTLLLTFKGKIPAINHRVGVTRTNEGALTSLWLVHWLPALAHYGPVGPFPGDPGESEWHLNPYHPIGEPFTQDISDYRVDVITPPQWEVVASGTECEEFFDDMRVTHVHAPQVRDFALATSPFYQRETGRSDSGVEVNFYFLDEVHPSLVQTAAESLDLFNELSGEYPYPELDAVENQMFVGGMEYSNLIMLDDDDMANSFEGHKTVAHEVAHQWFYMMLGNDQAREAWIDEGFGTYGGFMMVSGVDGVVDYFNWVKGRLPGWLAIYDERRLASPVWAFADWTNYYRVHYLKGAVMLNDLRQIMGDEAFFEFWREYYDRFLFMVITADDIIALASEVAGEDVSGFFEDWLTGNQAVPGP